MNIFVLDKDPIKAAQLQCDKHVVKMCTETAQMLCSAFESAPYKRSHYNHPDTIWSRTSKANYEWLITHGLALCQEYTYRYNKIHKAQSIIEWCKNNIDKLSFSNIQFTEQPKCMPNDVKCDDVVQSYKNYYNKYKSHFAKWTKRQKPDWSK
jgi:hypothetical protein